MNILVEILAWLINLLVILIIIRSLLSWFMKVGGDPLTRLLMDVTDPILVPIRNITMRLLPMPIDFSPIIAILLLQFLARMINSVRF